MRWTEDFHTETVADLQRLGLRACLICGSDRLALDDRPVVLQVGGTDRIRDEQTNVVYLLRIECSSCGHSLAFNAERFRDGDTPILQSP